MTVLELSTSQEKIFLINAYLPYFNANDIDAQLNEYRNTLACRPLDSGAAGCAACMQG